MLPINYFPGSRGWNQPLTRAIYGPLTNEVLDALPETEKQRTGLFHARYDDVSTLMLTVRPRLQNYASQGIQSSNVVEDVYTKMEG